MSLRERLLSRFDELVKAGKIELGKRDCEVDELVKAGQLDRDEYEPGVIFSKHLLKKLDPTNLTPLAERIEQEIEAYVNELIPKPIREAVLDRPLVGDNWPLFCGLRDIRANVVDENGTYCTWHDGVLEYDKRPEEDLDWSHGGPSISSGDELVYYQDGSTEDLGAYLEREFYAPQTDENWKDILWGDGSTTGDWVGLALHSLWRFDQNSNKPNWPYWPNDVSAKDLAEALGSSKDKDAKSIAKALRSGKTRPISRVLDGKRQTVPELDLTEVDASLQRWDLTRCALVLSAEKQVETDRRIPTIKMSAKPHSRAAFRMLAEGPPTKGGASNWNRQETGLTQQGDFELVWDGKKHPYQLNLLADEPLSAGIVKAIQEELQDDGLRDWLTFYRMAEAQGGTGDFRWSWTEHREIAGYDRRLKNKTSRTTDADLAASCVARIGRFTRAEARIKRERGGKIYWVRVGDHGLLDIPAGIDELIGNGRLMTVAAIRLNRAIYAGARTNERQPYYTLIHENIITLPRIERTLGTLLAFDWRYARDNDGMVVREARTLWDYARIQKGQWEQRKRWPEARRSLERALDVLGEKIGLNWHTETDEGPHGPNSPTARYILEPPAWFRDRLIHGVSPVLRNNTAGVPRTGGELAQWRAEHGLSLRHVAALVGVKSQVTIRNAESKLDVPIPSEWMTLLAKKRHG